MKRIAILVIAATDQPVYVHYINHYWADLIAYTNAHTPHIRVFLLFEPHIDLRAYKHLKDNIIQDDTADFDRLCAPEFHTNHTPGILSKTIHAFEVLQDEYDTFFRTNLSGILRLPHFDEFVQTKHRITYSGTDVWVDALRADLLAHDRIGPDKSIKSLAELDGYKGNTFISGSGYFLDASEVRTLVRNKDRLRYDIVDDVSIGLMFAAGEELPDFSLTIEPSLTTPEILFLLRQSIASHFRLEHFPLALAQAFWDELPKCELWNTSRGPKRLQSRYKIHFPLFDDIEARSNEVRLTHAGLKSHPRVELVDDPDSADYLIFCQNHLVSHCPFHTRFRPLKDRLKHKAIMLDYGDDPQLLYDADDFRWALYFKRSCVDRPGQQPPGRVRREYVSRAATYSMSFERVRRQPFRGNQLAVPRGDAGRHRDLWLGALSLRNGRAWIARTGHRTMIYTVFTAPANPALPWRATLLEYSWQRVRQSGELVRLAPMAPGATAPKHAKAVVEQTLAWNPHPYTNDDYAGYDTPSALMEWLFRSRAEGTILLLGVHSVLQSAVTEEVSPGSALAAPWQEMPTGDGPFGLAANLGFLECYCVNRRLALAPVRLPILIHSSDLRKIAPRWAELTAIIRAEGKDLQGKLRHADRLAYAVAAAEYRLEHAHLDLRNGTDDDTVSAPVIDYSRPVESARGETVWDKQAYRPWDSVDPEKAMPGCGREFLSLLNELATRRQSGADLAAKRPLRRGGVREARVLDDTQLEVPGFEEVVTLNSSAAVIWELCDGKHSLAEIVAELEQRFEEPRETLRTAVESTATELVAAGALEIEEVF